MSDQPSVLICCFDVLPDSTGLSQRVAEYLKALCNNYQVVVLANKTADQPHIERYQQAKLLRVPMGSGDLASKIQAFDRAVRRQVESEDYLIVHFFDPFGGQALCEHRMKPEREGPKYRLVYDAQTFPSQQLRHTLLKSPSDRQFLSKLLQQELFCLMNSDLVITGSEVTRKYIVDQGVPAQRVRVLRSPVDLKLFTSEVLGQPDATPMKVLYLGSQLGYQGLPTLLRAMQLAVRQVDLRLIIVGPKDFEQQANLTQLVNELKLAGKVEFRPPVAHEALYKVVATCDLGALTLEDDERNRRQGGPMSKLAQYLAGGRGVIAADLPITRELVPPGAGVFFECADVKGLAQQLCSLGQDPARRLKLGKAARLAAEEFDAARIHRRLLEFYVELAGQVPAHSDQDSDTEITQAAEVPSLENPAVFETDPSINAVELGFEAAPTPLELPAADSEVLEVGDDEVLDSAATTSDEDAPVLEADEAEAQAIKSDLVTLPSNLDPWLAQLVHGYCPSDSALFSRHTPPTNFPGRD